MTTVNDIIARAESRTKAANLKSAEGFKAAVKAARAYMAVAAIKAKGPEAVKAAEQASGVVAVLGPKYQTEEGFTLTAQTAKEITALSSAINKARVITLAAERVGL